MFGQRKRKISRIDLAKENAIKLQLLENLKESVKVLQAENKNRDVPLLHNESTARFCSVLEAILIHGLKETFLGRLSRWGGGEMSPRLPEPSFWTFVLVFSHKQVICTVDKYSQISSEVGRSRAWLRLGLNDGLMGSYLSAMSADKVSLSVHYESYAFLRDQERMDLLLTYIQGMEVFSFNLPTNVSMLNRWLPEPLELAGLWSSGLQPLTDTGAVDAAALAEESPPPPPAPSFIRTLAEPVPNNSFVQLGLLNEDEALRLILRSSPSPVSRPPSPTVTRALSPAPPGIRAISPAPPVNLQSRSSSRSVSPAVRGAEAVGYASLTVGVDTVDRSPSPEDVAELEPLQSSAEGGVVTAYVDSSAGDSFYNSAEVDPVADDVIGEDEVQEPLGGVLDQHSVSTSPQRNSSSPRGSRSPQRDSSPQENSSQEDPSSPSLEWEEEGFAGKARVEPAPLETTTLYEEIKALEKDGMDEEDEEEKPENDLSESNDSSCTCSTEGPRSDCLQCSNLHEKTRVSLSEFVEPDPASLDLIGQEGERRRRKTLHKIGFRDTPDISLVEFSLHRNLELLSCLDIIPREVGLDTQDWRCVDCTKAIGALFGNGKVCSYTKKHYCEDCHTDDLSVIPPRLLYNWDARPYPVARSSLRFLAEARTRPVIVLRTFNPALAAFVPALETVKQRRKKLTYLMAYISACPRAAEAGLRARVAEAVGGREHLLAETEAYSVADLEELHRGELAETLLRAVRSCLLHVDSCIVCAGRGFICEVCQDTRPVYPFNLESTSQCQDCCTVFHSSCAQTLHECPRCERIAARSLNLLVTQSKLSRELAHIQR